MNGSAAGHDLTFFLDGVVRTTADLRDDNLRLKTENENLEGQLSGVMPELKRLRKERAALKAAICALLRQNGAFPACAEDQHWRSGTFATLPHEILQHIFNLAVASEPTYQFDSSVQPGAHNPWLDLLRTKKAFPLICRAAVWPGMSVLYSEIVLRRMGQVCALAETLRILDVGPRLATFIKSIQWDSCVVAAPCSDVIREDLGFIFAQCTRLRSFSYHPHAAFPRRRLIPDGDDCEGYFNPLWFVMMPPSVPDHPLLQIATSNLQSLDLDLGMNDMLLRAIHKILPTLNTLQSLALGQWPKYPSPLPEGSEIMKLPAASLPSLTNLQIFATSPAVDQYLCSRWELPQLSRLTILLCTGWPGGLLARFGRGLRYLHLFPPPQAFFASQTYYPTLEACSTLVDVCPVLEHLVVPLLETSPGSYPLLLNSPTLVHLDFWSTAIHRALWGRQDQSVGARYRRTALKPESTVPALRSVRVLFTSEKHPLPMALEEGAGAGSDCKSHVRNPDWPWICHPDLLCEGSEDVLYYRFAQGWVAQTVAALIPQDLAKSCWKGRDLDHGEWPAVYGHLAEQTRELSDASASERARAADAGRLEGVDVEQPEGDGAEGEGSSAHARSEENDITMKEDDAESTGTDEEEPELEPEEQEPEEEEMAEAAAALALPEYPVAQMDRATVLTAFRSSRDRESYEHTNIWDNH